MGRSAYFQKPAQKYGVTLGKGLLALLIDIAIKLYKVYKGVRDACHLTALAERMVQDVPPRGMYFIRHLYTI